MTDVLTDLGQIDQTRPWPTPRDRQHLRLHQGDQIMTDPKRILAADMYVLRSSFTGRYTPPIKFQRRKNQNHSIAEAIANSVDYGPGGPEMFRETLKRRTRKESSSGKTTRHEFEDGSSLLCFAGVFGYGVHPDFTTHPDVVDAFDFDVEFREDPEGSADIKFYPLGKIEKYHYLRSLRSFVNEEITSNAKHTQHLSLIHI